MVLLAAAGGAVYLKLNGNIKSFDPDTEWQDRPPQAVADADGNKPVNILLIGSDTRGGNNGDLGGGEVGGAHSDTVILLHVYADHKHAVGVSIPRDALVTIPSCPLPNGKRSKEQTNVMFNSAFEMGNSKEGNPVCTQHTVEKLTGIFVDHTVIVDFQGFAAMTKAVDGVDVCLPNAIHENDINQKLTRKGAEVLKKGRQTVQGQQALHYVRLRHGIGDGSDIGRMKRQQAFIGSFISKVKKQGLSPTSLLPLANAATSSITVDTGLDSPDKLLKFALSLKDVDLHDLKFVTTPWRPNAADINRVDLVRPDVDNLWATLRADRTIDGQDATGKQPGASSAPTEPSATPSAASVQPPAADNSAIKVAVYNGTTTTGLAAKASDLLEAARFTVTKTESARSTKHAGTVVEYGAGQKANADKVAALFPGATTSAGTAAGLSLILGKDYATAQSTPSAAASSAPPTLSAQFTAEARSADDDICANTTFGTGG